MALPSGLIQIKGRRGFYTNITVPAKYRKLLGKSVIQKKAGDTLEEAEHQLWEEQSKARNLFKALEKDTPELELRKRYRQWQLIEQQQQKEGGPKEEEMLSARESLELEIDEALNPTADAERPSKAVYSSSELKLIKEADALLSDLHHFEEWLTERELTTGSVSPLVKKRWRAVLQNFSKWSKDEYPARAEKTDATGYKRHLLTRKNRNGVVSKHSSVSKEIRDLSAMWKWASQHGMASTNIWEGLARNLDQSRPKVLPEPARVTDADKTALNNNDIKYLIQRFTGCRKQGVCGLRRRDIDLKNRLIHFVEYEEGGFVRRLKNGQECHVPIHSRLLPILERALASMPDGPLWPNEYKPSEQSWGDRYGDSFKDKYGFNSHDLRRIVETQLAKENVSPYFTYYVTGHRLPGMSEVTTKYVRPTPEELQAVVELIH